MRGRSREKSPFPTRVIRMCYMVVLCRTVPALFIKEIRLRNFDSYLSMAVGGPPAHVSRLPDFVVNVDSINIFKSRLDNYWINQDIVFDYTADLDGTGDRSEYISSY